MLQKHVAQNDHDQGQGNQTESKITPPTGTAVAIWSFLAISFLLWAFVPDYINSDSERVKLLVESVFSVALVIVVVSQTYINLRQARALDVQEGIFRQQTETMQKALRVETQPYLCIHSIELDHGTNSVYVEIENLGRLPADSIEIDIWWKFEVPPEVGDYKSTSFQESRKWGRKTELFRGNLRITSRFLLREWLSDVGMVILKSGSGLLTMEGLITYYDGFIPREPRRTHFAFEYRLTERRWYSRRIVSPEELDAESTNKQLPAQNPN
jgi:hypothetical protein